MNLRDIIDRIPETVAKCRQPLSLICHFSFGRFTTEAEVDHAAQSVRHAVEKLRELSPLWDMYQDGVDLNTIEWAAH